jgi:hypothetical protein
MQLACSYHTFVSLCNFPETVYTENTVRRIGLFCLSLFLISSPFTHPPTSVHSCPTRPLIVSSLGGVRLLNPPIFTYNSYAKLRSAFLFAHFKSSWLFMCPNQSLVANPRTFDNNFIRFSQVCSEVFAYVPVKQSGLHNASLVLRGWIQCSRNDAISSQR